MPVQLSEDLSRLFPAGVIGVELREPGDPARLLPAEAAAIAPMATGRAREFAAGRMCARRALAELGISDFPLLRAADRQPLWPPGIVGSITHTDGYCAAVVARRTEFRGLGIDSEVVGAVGEHLWQRLFVADEIESIEQLPRVNRCAAAAVLFSAKEAFYKCQYPAFGRRYDFKEVHVHIDAWVAQGSFALAMTSPARDVEPARHQVSGRYSIGASIISTGVAFLERE